MSIYTLLGIFAGIAVLLTLLRYAFDRSISLPVIFLQSFVGAVFIFSGFIKENDPIGFSYKMEEYFEVFQDVDSVKKVTDVPIMGADTVIKTTANTTDTIISPKQVGTEKHISWDVVTRDSFYNKVMQFLHRHALLLAFLVLIFEILVGFMILIGAKKMLALWLSLAMIVFFTFLTFYSAKYNKVTDCGCFGDFMHLTPWTSFWKDVTLLVLILLLFLGRKRISPLFSARPEKIAFVSFAGLSVLFPLYTYNYLPILDFRPYRIGTNIIEAMKIPPGGEGKFETVLLYKNIQSGEVKEFTLQNYPWQDSLHWKHDSTITKTIVEPVLAPIHDFHINTVDGSEYTEDILNAPGPKFFLVCHDLQDAKRSAFGKVNELAALCRKDSVMFIALTSSTEQMIKDFKNEVKADFDFYTCDDTQLKTMVRSNPGLVLLDGPVVKAMWPASALPSYTEVKEKYFKK
jgi:uncharacterized membrane protein YphA (DoxX/SURF4 family)